MINTMVMCVFVLQFQVGDYLYEKTAEVACSVLQEVSDPISPHEGHKVLLVDCTESMDAMFLSKKPKHIAASDPIRHVLYEKDCF